MPSKNPRDLIVVGRLIASPVARQVVQLGQWTVNGTASPVARILFDRKAVIREIWFSATAVPNDPDGTMLINALVNDVSEGADDTIVSSFDAEAVILAANKAYKATLAVETSENQNTVEAGDTLRFTLVNNSAAVTTNADVTAHVLYQAVKGLNQ